MSYGIIHRFEVIGLGHIGVERPPPLPALEHFVVSDRTAKLLQGHVNHHLVSEGLGCHTDTVDCPLDWVFEPERGFLLLLRSRFTLYFGRGSSRGLGLLSLQPGDLGWGRGGLAGGSRGPLSTSRGERLSILGYRHQDGGGFSGGLVWHGRVVLCRW